MRRSSSSTVSTTISNISSATATTAQSTHSITKPAFFSTSNNGANIVLDPVLEQRLLRDTIAITEEDEEYNNIITDTQSNNNNNSNHDSIESTVTTFTVGHGNINNATSDNNNMDDENAIANEDEEGDKFLRDVDLRLDFGLSSHAATNMNRRASFSAMSGPNYTLNSNEPYATENVEFSTPQFYDNDGGAADEENWLNSFSNGDQATGDFIQPRGVDADGDAEMADVVGASGDAAVGYSFYDVPSRNFGTLFTHSSNKQTQQQQSQSQSTQQSQQQQQETQPQQPTEVNPPPFKPLSPIMQEELDAQPDPESTLHKMQSMNHNCLSPPTCHEKVRSWQETLFNQDINDLEALADLNISERYGPGLAQGYSFYGGNGTGTGANSGQSTVSASLGNGNGADLSSNATISPILLDNSLSQQNSPVGGGDGDESDVEK
ncbi:unnamed protein product, partial [Ambrosiozyma monospora]